MSAQQNKVLHLFVASDTPDVYINVMGYCVEHFSISRVVLLNIVKDKGQKGRAESFLNNLRDRISKQLSILQEGKYLHKPQDSDEWKQKDIQVQSHDRARYTKLASYTIMPHVIVYSDLEQAIDEVLIAANHNYIFDVSAILKTYLVDVFVLLQSKNIRDIYTFELKLRTRSYDENELIHKLSLDSGDYEYVNLTQSLYTRSRSIRATEDRSLLDRANIIIETLINMQASTFSSIIMFIYGLFVIGCWLAGAILIRKSDWNKLEPWMFVLFGIPIFSYIVSILSLSIFQREFSFRPKDIRSWLSKRKRASIKKKLGMGSS